MHLTLYDSGLDARVIDKSSLTPIQGMTYSTLNPTVNMDIVHPVFILTYHSGMEICNYLYCSELSRYYFAQPTLCIGNTIRYDCTVDVLNSFPIGNINCTIRRTAKYTKPTYVKDDLLPYSPNVGIGIRDFPNTPHITGSGQVPISVLIHTI